MRRPPAARRLHAQPGQHDNVMGSYHPAQAEPPVIPDYMPLMVVYVSPAGMAVSQTVPLYTADPTRAPVPATGPGRWGQLHAAGRP